MAGQRARSRSRPTVPRRAGAATGGTSVFLAVLTALAAVVFAAAPTAGQDGRSQVLIDGREIFRVGPLKDVEASERARLIERRIELLLASPEQIAPARVEPGDAADEAVVTVAGAPIVVVTAEDAADNLSTVDDLAAAWATTLDAELARAAERRGTTAARFYADVRAAFAAAFVRMFRAAVTMIPRVLAAALVLALFGALATAARWLMRRGFARSGVEPTVQNLIQSLIYVGIWGSGALASMAALGFDPQTVVTGLGLTSLALGFGLRDIVSNYVSGVLILSMRPFRLGDVIAVGATEGEVEQIDLRATHIRAFDGGLVLMPNGEVFTSRIVKNTAPVRRTAIPIVLDYDNDLDAAARAATRAVGAVPGVLPDPAPTARVDALQPDGVVIDVRYWTDSRHADIQEVADAVRRALVDGLRAAGISLPNPALREVIGGPSAPTGWASDRPPADPARGRRPRRERTADAAAANRGGGA